MAATAEKVSDNSHMTATRGNSPVAYGRAAVDSLCSVGQGRTVRPDFAPYRRMVGGGGT